MKKLIVLISITIALSQFGCGLAYKQYSTKSYQPNLEYKASVGMALVSEEAGLHNTVYDVRYGGYKWELVYAGIENNTISIDYREYTVDKNQYYIKDGFTQHLKYDLSKSKVIKYKDLQMEVTEVTGNDIKFKVLN